MANRWPSRMVRSGAAIAGIFQRRHVRLLRRAAVLKESGGDFAVCPSSGLPWRESTGAGRWAVWRLMRGS